MTSARSRNLMAGASPGRSSLRVDGSPGLSRVLGRTGGGVAIEVPAACRHAEPVPKLTVQRHTVTTMAQPDWDDAWALATRYNAGTRAAFEASVRAKKYLVTIRDRTTRVLVGMGTVDVYPFAETTGSDGRTPAVSPLAAVAGKPAVSPLAAVAGKPAVSPSAAVAGKPRRCIIIYTGNMVFEPSVRGFSLIQRVGFRCYLEARLRHPLTPVWLFYDTFSYKSYLMLVNNFSEFWPRYDQPTPPAVADFIDRLGQHRYAAGWDSGRGLALRGERRLREGVADVTSELLSNPHVRYFYERNPGCGEGDMLAVLAPLRMSNWLAVLRRARKRRANRPS